MALRTLPADVSGAADPAIPELGSDIEQVCYLKWKCLSSCDLLVHSAC